MWTFNIDFGESQLDGVPMGNQYLTARWKNLKSWNDLFSHSVEYPAGTPQIEENGIGNCFNKCGHGSPL